MRRKAIKVLLIVIAIIILGGAITLYILGKPAKVNTDKKLNDWFEWHNKSVLLFDNKS